MSQKIIVRYLPKVEYHACWKAMREFTDQRDESTVDELWMVQHPPVFTLGQAGKEEHVLAPGDIPLVHCDRGGQVTYHGPGQPVAYILSDIRRLHIGARGLVTAVENGAIATLAELGIQAHNDLDAPGVYVEDRKIASLGLRIRRGRSYHGLAFNHDMDMEPWQRINPCGHANQPMTSVALEGVTIKYEALEQMLAKHISNQLGLEYCVNTPPEWVDSIAA